MTGTEATKSDDTKLAIPPGRQSSVECRDEWLGRTIQGGSRVGLKVLGRLSNEGEGE